MSWLLSPDDGDGDKKPTCDTSPWTNPQKESATQFTLQLGISLALGSFAYLFFCMIRPSWKSLYAARTRYLDPSLGIPQLPNTFCGWILPVYRITDSQVLKAAGLDAFCFLKFFKMAMKILSIMLFFAVTILLPIYHNYDDTGNTGLRMFDFEDLALGQQRNESHLWAITVFTYLFTCVTLAVLEAETINLIAARQNYLGSRVTPASRTFMLWGIPKELRTKQAIKDLIEKLAIGKVETVSVCQDWSVLDSLVKARDEVLRKLERAWASHLKQKSRSSPSPSCENSRLLPGGSTGCRPTVRIGFPGRRVDAIDHYQERLDLLDAQIAAERNRPHEAVDLAFVTMDSIEACQMATQAVLDPHPGRLLTRLAPSPTDIEWENTYAPKSTRGLKSLTVTLFVMFLTVIWLLPVGLLASLASICTIETTAPALADFLKEHSIIRALVQSGLPTIAVTGLNSAVPYIYEYLSHRQGVVSRADVELSMVSKNFFFIFFNVFLMFTVFGTVGSIADVIRDSFKDTTYLASTLARAIVGLGDFYTNLIMLNAIGILPFRLLQAGSVFLFPFYRWSATTPRERDELLKPDVFSYGFHLPIALFFFMLSLVYSVLPGGYWCLGFGLLYFVHGYFTYKYQLVYSMNQSQHADGRIWPMICYRIMLGLMVFQLTMSGFLALRRSYLASLFIVPLLAVVVWRSWVFKRKFEPLTRYISLQSIRNGEYDDDASAILDDSDLEALREHRQRASMRRGSSLHEDREQKQRFVNPSLVTRYVQCAHFSQSHNQDSLLHFSYHPQPPS
ncbi:protein of unknown function DUF221 domain containing protein [Rhypophila decipiens]